MSIPDTPALSATAYRALAAIAALLGLSCAGVNAWFFTLGMQHFEPNETIRIPLIAAGVLMVVTEHTAFGLAALLPQLRFAGLRRALLVLGVMLLVFEVTSMYATQAGLAQSSGATATAQATRVQNLRAAIDSRRAAVDALRTTGERQGASNNSWTRHLGAQTLRDALAAEREITPLAAELASLQATTAPTLAHALGEQGLIASNAARAALIGGMGLLMLSAAGALVTAARGEATATLESPHDHTPHHHRHSAARPLFSGRREGTEGALPVHAPGTAGARPADARGQATAAGAENADRARGTPSPVTGAYWPRARDAPAGHTHHPTRSTNPSTTRATA